MLPNSTLIHPLRGLKLPMAEVARRAGVNRVVLNQVVTGIRNRPGILSIIKLVETFPELNLKQIAQWRWPAKAKKAARRAIKKKPAPKVAARVARVRR